MGWKRSGNADRSRVPSNYRSKCPIGKYSPESEQDSQILTISCPNPSTPAGVPVRLLTTERQSLSLWCGDGVEMRMRFCPWPLCFNHSSRLAASSKLSLSCRLEIGWSLARSLIWKGHEAMVISLIDLRLLISAFPKQSCSGHDFTPEPLAGGD